MLRKIPLGQIVGIPIRVFEAGYSKDQELEADREGTALAVSAGYSPRGAARPQPPLDEAARLAQQSLEQYFMSHPPASERINQINHLIGANRWDEEKPLRMPPVPAEAESNSARMPE
jgi:beta-barrel assembly-enhancing protease